MFGELLRSGGRRLSAWEMGSQEEGMRDTSGGGNVLCLHDGASSGVDTHQIPSKCPFKICAFYSR